MNLLYVHGTGLKMAMTTIPLAHIKTNLIKTSPGEAFSSYTRWQRGTHDMKAIRMQYILGHIALHLGMARIRVSLTKIPKELKMFINTENE